MAALRRNIQRRRAFFAATLFGLTSGSVIAVEPTSIDGFAGRVSLQRRTDANAQRDIEAAKEYLRRLQSTSSSASDETDSEQNDTPKESETRSNEISDSDEPLKLEMPEYDKVDSASATAPTSDDSATVKPALGTQSSSNAPSGPVITIYESMIPDDCGPIVYRPIDLCLPVESSSTPVPSSEAKKPVQASTETVNQWSDEELVRRIEDLSDGAFVISERSEPSTTSTRTSNYRESDTVLPLINAAEVLPAQPQTSIKELAPPTYSTILTSTTNPFDESTRFTSASSTSYYAADEAALAQPSLSPSATSSSAVQPAAFQGFGVPAPGFSTPDATASQPPSLGVPPTNYGAPAAPPASSNSVLPSSPSTTIVPSTPAPMTNPGTINAAPSVGNAVPYDMPNYQRTAPIVTGEPFVTEGPCQFDAAYMVSPAYGVAQASASQCGPYLPAYQAAPGATTGIVPGYYAPPTVMPNQAPGLFTSNSAGHRPLFGLGQENYNVQIGRGIIGQPVAYVPGQTFRNFLRYIFP